MGLRITLVRHKIYTYVTYFVVRVRNDIRSLLYVRLKCFLSEDFFPATNDRSLCIEKRRYGTPLLVRRPVLLYGLSWMRKKLTNLLLIRH